MIKTMINKPKSYCFGIDYNVFHFSSVEHCIRFQNVYVFGLLIIVMIVLEWLYALYS